YSSNGGPYGVRGFNNAGSLTWTYPVTSAVWDLAVTPDIQGDGVSDIAGFVGFNGTVFTVSGSTGGQFWTVNLGASIDGYLHIIENMESDGAPDKNIITSGPKDLYRLDLRTGNIIWSAFLDGNYIHSVDELSDVTGDGRKDIVAGTQNSNLYVTKGDSGRVVFTYNFGTATTNTVEQVAALRSIDGNISSEFLGGSRTGKLICFSGGPNGVVGIKAASDIIPEKFSLSQNYPNPFNPVSTIKFDITQDPRRETQDVRLIVYDALGKEVSTLVNEDLSPGTYEVEFDGRNLSSGIYFYRLTAGSFSEVKRMMLIK
ncbi:MAG: T9SS type A sorting domain-containing protein, partial [Ignavibacteria bacterium]